jgi:uncharacterized protein (DUF885 family)
MIFRTWSALAAAFLLAACGPPSPSPSAASPARVAPREALARLVEAYWDESAAYRTDPLEPIGVQSLADARALEQRYLDAVLSLPRPAAGSEALTYEVFRRERALALLGFTYPAELLPVNPFQSAPLTLAIRASAGAAANLGGDAVWQARAEEFARWTDTAIAQLRDGVRRGYVLPRVLVEELLPTLALLAADSPDNPFNAALPSPTPELTRAIRTRILPSYARLHAFLHDEYLPRARAGVSLSDLPLGEAWYAYQIRLNTGSTLGAAELHALGAAEVQRIEGKVQALLAEGAYAGNLAGYLEALRREPRAGQADAADDPVGYVRALEAQAAAAAAPSFAELPRAAPGVRRVAPFRASSAPLISYQSAYPGSAYLGDSGAALLWVNGQAGAVWNPMTGGEARVLREAVPGHHLERSLAAANAALPRFRRFGGDRAFIEGWGLYAATLAEDLGLARDAPEHLGPLLQELDCALGLVLDTGLHGQRWTRAKAIDYLRGHLPLEEPAANRIVDRVIALPGEALACTVGLRKLRALRAEAQQRLGARFELRAFHSALLEQGALPLDLLESSMHRWMESVH